MAMTWSRCHKKLQFVLAETHQIPVFRSRDFSKEILSDLVRKDVAELIVSFPISSTQLRKSLR